MAKSIYWPISDQVGIMQKIGYSKDEFLDILAKTPYARCQGVNGTSVLDWIITDVYGSFTNSLLHEQYLRYKYHLDLTKPYSDATNYAYKLQLPNGSFVIYLVMNGELEKIIVNPFVFLLDNDCRAVRLSDLDDLIGLYILYQSLVDLSPATIFEYLPTILKFIKIGGYNIDPYLASNRFYLEQDLLSSPLRGLENRLCLYCGCKLGSDGYFCKKQHSEAFTKSEAAEAPKRYGILNSLKDKDDTYATLMKEVLQKTILPIDEISGEDISIKFHCKSNDEIEFDRNYQCASYIDKIPTNFIKSLDGFYSDSAGNQDVPRQKGYSSGLIKGFETKARKQELFQKLYKDRVITVEPIGGSAIVSRLVYKHLDLYEKVEAIVNEVRKSNRIKNNETNYTFTSFMLHLSDIEKFLIQEASHHYPKLEMKSIG